MLKKSDRTKTLEQLDGEKWGKPSFPSSLVVRCHALRQKPIGNFDASDLRIMIGQKFGRQWLLPLAIELLEQNPLLESDFYAGDLLQQCLRASDEYPEFNIQLREICCRADKEIGMTGEYVDPALIKQIYEFAKTHA
ncbi:MAG: hypothetical protein HWE25_06115 [Alphaproteobacteria bacterium]|nr:hypothetical protein [Alphaproteobacteria bacterium]